MIACNHKCQRVVSKTILLSFDFVARIIFHLRNGHNKRVQAPSYGVPGLSVGISYGPHPRIRKMPTPIAGCKHLLSLSRIGLIYSNAGIYVKTNVLSLCARWLESSALEPCRGEKTKAKPTIIDVFIYPRVKFPTLILEHHNDSLMLLCDCFIDTVCVCFVVCSFSLFVLQI